MAIIVVSDASPIRALHHLGLLSLGRDLYGSVIVPEAVRRELLERTTTCPALEIREFEGFSVQAPRFKPSDLGVPPDLDPGETEAITLAIELHADLVLMDERKGTDAARQLGLTTIGVIGVLLEAKRRGLIKRVLPCVDRLVSEMRFYASPTLRLRVKELADE